MLCCMSPGSQLLRCTATADSLATNHVYAHASDPTLPFPWWATHRSINPTLHAMHGGHHAGLLEPDLNPNRRHTQ